MTFIARSRSTIRTDLLSAWSARWTTAGLELDTRTSSFSYRIADGLALILAPLESWAFSLAAQILPDKATRANLNRHGEVEGLPRQPASAAVLTVRVNGTPSATINVGGSQLRYGSSGLRFRANASPIVLNGSGYLDQAFTATTAGPTANLANGTTLVWDSTPTNATASATVQATVTAGESEETDSEYAARILARRQERPASGNRADWRDWVEQCDGVDDAYVYPLQHGAFGPDTLGSVAVVVLGPAQGTNTTNTRLIASPRLVEIKGRIEGTHDVSGAVIADGTQLRPATVDSSDYFIISAIPVSQAVTITLTLGAGYAFAWAPATTYAPTGWNNSTKVLTFASDPALAAAGQLIAVRETGVGSSRGGYRYAKIASVNHGAFTITITLDSAFDSTTVDTTGTAKVRPLPQNADALRQAVFDYFDALGPGDSTGGSKRWPDEATRGRSTLYRNVLAARAIETQGVLDANVVTPAANVSVTFAELITLTELIFQ